tara:strand:+ start:39 stop:614 length:576 start_codon:yes stop_codon:yes gene_type:complete
MKTYTQIEPDFIQTSETHENGSFTSGIIRRFETKTRQVQDGNEEVKVGTEQVQVESEFETQDVFETQPKYISETYSPWDELNPELVQWLDVEEWQAEQDSESNLQAFKSSRQLLINNATVDANEFIFDADEISIGRLANAILAAMNEGDDYIMQWSLADTSTGVMTDVTLSDLKLAHKLAVLNMAQAWGVN